MKPVRVKAAVVALLMVLAFAGANAWRPTLHLADSRPKIELDALFPKMIGDWVVDDRMPVQLVSPDTAALLNKLYNQTLSRTYVNPKGERIMLSVAYGGDQSDGTRAHRPEVCYPAQGFQIVLSQSGQLSLPTHSIPVRRLVAKQGGRTEPITYWTVIGDKVTITGTEAKLAQLSYGMRGVVPDGLLVRVSTIDTNAESAFLLHQQFIKQMAGAIPQASMALVVGGGGV
jgi:EpsI family protein